MSGEHSNPINNPKAKISMAKMLEQYKGKNKHVEDTSSESSDEIPSMFIEPPKFQLEKMLSNDEFKKIISSVPQENLYPLQAVIRDPKYDLLYKKKEPNALITNVLTFTLLSIDNEMLRFLEEASTPKLNKKVEQDYRPLLKETVNWIVTNGPERGLYNRFIEGMKELKKEWNIDPKDYSQYLEYLGFKKENVVAGLIGTPVDQMYEFDVNEHSSAGVPYYCLKSECVEQWWKNLLELYNLLANSSKQPDKLTEYIRSHQSMFVVALKNKLDRYLRTKAQDKIRPYYVYPAHLSVLFSIVMQYVTKHLKHFSDPDTTVNSSVCIGFSWGHGGGQRLYDWLANKEGAVQNRFKFLAYADDSIFKITYDDGSVIVITPDITMMDMSLHNCVGKNFYKLISSAQCLGENISKVWLSVLKMCCDLAFQHLVLLKQSQLFYKKQGLSSGSIGTSWFDNYR